MKAVSQIELPGATLVTYKATPPFEALLFEDGRVAIELEPSPEERALILRGENVRLWVQTGKDRAVPHFALEVLDECQG